MPAEHAQTACAVPDNQRPNRQHARSSNTVYHAESVHMSGSVDYPPETPIASHHASTTIHRRPLIHHPDFVHRLSLLRSHQKIVARAPRP
ncbi:hypothetical protein AVEN_110281-1 [Araneus ventricosus]|uniref:Uncharacterized protein n=1 Tax=Araneus ventricosus TaxID=182803 RepID=A0A4Y2DSM5_ARAVE|nr:hypothetical protein AVEN_110281-1 [Araneus ventricosus]